MRDWVYILWFILILLVNTIDFSFKIGDKNEINIQSKPTEQKAEEPKTDSPKASW